LFEELQFHHNHENNDIVVVKKIRKPKAGVKMPLPNLHPMGGNLQSTHSQEQFIHREVRVARVELLDLLCVELDLPTPQDSFNSTNCLDWTFGQKLNMPNGTSYWATDSRYFNAGADCQSERRDVLFLKGSETLSVNVDGQVKQTPTALCCQCICFITITNINEMYKAAGHSLPGRLQDEMKSDSLTFILGRWLTAHPLAVRRDSLLRPICPGPLQYNHCLWTYAKSRRVRKIMVDNQGNPTLAFQRAASLFGNTRIVQSNTWTKEQNAYYCLITPASIVNTMNICREYLPSTMVTSDTWLETVTAL